MVSYLMVGSCIRSNLFFGGGGYSYPLSYGEVNSYTNIWFKNWIFAL